MKRNILLLTAVVLAAVMLSGCILPFMGIKVNFTEPKNGEEKVVLKATDLAKRYKKGAAIEINFEFTGDRVAEEFTFEFESEDEATDLQATFVPAEGDKLGGYKVEGKLGKKDVTIKLTPAAI